MIRKRALHLLPIAALAASSGCGKQADPTALPKAVAAPIERSAACGDVELSVTAGPAELNTEQDAYARIEIVAPAGTVSSAPDLAELVEQTPLRYDIRTTKVAQRNAAPTSDQRLRWSALFKLSPVLDGEFELPAVPLPLPAEALEQCEEDGSARATEPIALTVALAQDAALSEEELARIETLDPKELDAPVSATAWTTAAVVVVLVAAGLILLRRRRTAAALAAEPPIPANEWATAALSALRAEKLPERGELQTFHYRLSDIVREYIERRFDISAPDMTTEEFLAASTRDLRFDRAHTRVLSSFLQACDLVKYAKQLPAVDECYEALKTAAQFVEATRPRELAATEERTAASRSADGTREERAA